MLWMFESKEYAVILAASFLAGLLMDMILKKVTKQGETKYTAFLSVCITAVFLGTYGTNEHHLHRKVQDMYIMRQQMPCRQ